MVMVLHPAIKTEYFHKNRSNDLIQERKSLLHEEYCANYEKTAGAGPIRRERSATRPPCGHLSIATCPRAREIRKYLRLPVEEVTDPLKWWANNRLVYPNLHRMALDYLSIPGLSSYHIIELSLTTYLACSTAVERVFSQCRQILSSNRNGVSPFSIQAFLCVGSWARCGIIDFDDVLTALRDA
jgi:hypothetical protein